MATLLADHARCAALVQQYDSPVNLIDPRPLGRNADELVAAGRSAGVPIGLYFARKANKALSLVDEVVRRGTGWTWPASPNCGRFCSVASPGTASS